MVVLFLHHLGWSHPEQMVIDWKIGMVLTMGCLNFINIQTTAVTTGATSLMCVNRICMKCLSLWCLGFIPNPLITRHYMYWVTKAATNIFIEIFNVFIIFFLTIYIIIITVYFHLSATAIKREITNWFYCFLHWTDPQSFIKAAMCFLSVM